MSACRPATVRWQCRAAQSCRCLTVENGGAPSWAEKKNLIRAPYASATLTTTRMSTGESLVLNKPDMASEIFVGIIFLTVPFPLPYCSQDRHWQLARCAARPPAASARLSHRGYLVGDRARRQHIAAVCRMSTWGEQHLTAVVAAGTWSQLVFSSVLCDRACVEEHEAVITK